MSEIITRDQEYTGLEVAFEDDPCAAPLPGVFQTSQTLQGHITNFLKLQAG